MFHKRPGLDKADVVLTRNKRQNIANGNTNQDGTPRGSLVLELPVPTYSPRRRYEYLDNEGSELLIICLLRLKRFSTYFYFPKYLLERDRLLLHYYSIVVLGPNLCRLTFTGIYF